MTTATDLHSAATTRHVPTERSGIDLASLPRFFVEIALRERAFLMLLGVSFFLVGVFFENAAVARWLGFAFASYSAIGNDSIQTIGTFIASNGRQKWWVLWLFIGGLFLLTAGYSFVVYSGDVSYERLAAKGFESTPTSFTFLQVAAPLFLLVLTRLRMPVSTTFLLLSSFAATGGSLASVLTKSLAGYGVAFVLSIAVWWFGARWMAARFTGPAHPAWRVAQWITSGILWCIWLMQDAANVAVYLPRQLSVLEFAAFAIVIFLGLGLLFFLRGERIQEVVNEKSDVVDVRAATVIDLVYGVILYIFLVVSVVPMSTTWVFIGLLGGRELAMALRKTSERSFATAGKLLLKDIALVSVGLAISIILAMAVNDQVRRDLLGSIGM